jgi:putative ABC transport system permease protein
MFPRETVLRTVSGIPDAGQSEAWLVTDARIRDASVPFEEGLLSLFALPDNTGLLRLDVVAGRNLQPRDTGVIVLNSAVAANRKQLAVGATVPLEIGTAHTSFRVIGIAREQFSPPAGYISLEDLDRLGYANKTNSIRIALSSTHRISIEAFRNILDQKLEQAHLPVQNSATTAGFRFVFDQHMLMIYVLLILVSSLIAAIGALGLMTTMSLNVLERRRELGILPPSALLQQSCRSL